ncbi:helix-turn-helix transcriptional regulator [Dyadobacter fanqingshengii]|uniref:LuxR C-terminal-related transcriptional regulator n=1 Tax=Dyadobacter fanqingshengii TaxID=2906443 RepID=A0A9X1PBX2_9BACT|nr:AAA family ATPase [Dyadobacter fanqingshengii]MCF0042146.1 LuxR C-terminal-related transcriptional regulator [Dyadobacter fanqingshengii]USJ35321.1 LuxR C-terminal-related transcriptional regulator [Dyadobacter fanqingshengii]
MELIERSGFLTRLNTQFDDTINGEGHCILLSGEAGMGKSSLVKAFCTERKGDCRIFRGTCDALFTPRPLAPLYDIIWQLGNDTLTQTGNKGSRGDLFADFLLELKNLTEPSVIIFEDIHWADEATLDFIKFLSRRINQLQCMFILTYRNDEIHSRHPLRNLLGQLPIDSFSRLELLPLSKHAVDRMAAEKGYSGEDVYEISGGNPFYVTEILASYSSGLPESIKDSILSVCARQSDETRNVWEILSVAPTGLEIKYLEKLIPSYTGMIMQSLDSKILLLKADKLFFKHELYRRTIESSISPFAKTALNKSILDLLLEAAEPEQETERIIHHAERANEYDLMLRYIPLAARQAISLGAHLEAAKLYCTAITYYKGQDMARLIHYYESYAYECYLTNQTREAIKYQEKLLALFQQQNDVEKIGDCMRFLSRLWWFEGNRNEAEKYGFQAVEVLEKQPDSRVKAQAFSNISQLKMLSHQPHECMTWGQLAIAMAKKLDDMETLSHALNNVGTVQMEMPELKQLGIDVLQESLHIALKGSFHEHAARAYTNLGASSIRLKDFAFAKKILDEGIQYCEKRELDSWTNYMVSLNARMDMETGAWDDAYRTAEQLLANDEHPSVVTIGPMIIVGTIKMRRAEAGALPILLRAQEKAFETMELQRIIPAMVALLEYEWLTGEKILSNHELDRTIEMTEIMGNIYENSEFCFWLLKVRSQEISVDGMYEKYKICNHTLATQATQFWQAAGCPYEEAITLFDGDEKDKSNAIKLVQKMGATATYQKLKSVMLASGIRRIPRGMRQTTSSNVANLTLRELTVLQLLKEGMQNKEIASKLFISSKTVDHHISALLVKLNVNSRVKAVNEALKLEILK